MNKNLLVVTYYFPPSGGPGVQRVLKHIKYLPYFGWNPIVLTVENPQYQALDYSLLDQLDPSLIIYKTKIFEPYELYRKFTGKASNVPIDVNVIKKEGQKRNLKEKIAEFIRSTFFIPDARVFWIRTAVPKGLEIIKEHKIDAIYSSSPPYTCAIIARKLKKLTNTKWVFGLRDPWTDFISTPKRWSIPKMIDRSLEYKCLQEADSIECAWEGIIKDAVKKYPQLNKNKFYYIPNGFDSDDIPRINFDRNEKFTLTYTGSMYGRRNPQSIILAFENLLDKKLISDKDFKLKFIGRFGNEVNEMIASSKIKENIEILTYIPHSESVKELLKSDALLLIVDESKESDEIVPGKVFEYLGTKKPILAIAPPESAVAKLIKETNSGFVAHQTEIDKISQLILHLINSWKNNIIPVKINENAIHKYERKESTRKLAEILDNLM